MPKTPFKPLPMNEQTIVITGASSGIGLATAKMAALRGARVVMASRNGEELQRCVDEITGSGGKAIAVMADVSQLEDISRIRDKALTAFGQINTWVNNTRISLQGYLMESAMQDERNLFETNFWGTKMGSCIAVEEMSEKGGTLINMGSEVSVSAQPLLGMYIATKQAVKAFTDSLRSEIKDKGLPVEVCLVHATANENIAARAILKCAVHPQRDVYVGGPTRLSAILDTFFPKIKDIVSESRMNDLRTENKKRFTKTLSGTIKQLRKSNNHQPGREV